MYVNWAAHEFNLQKIKFEESHENENEATLNTRNIKKN